MPYRGRRRYRRSNSLISRQGGTGASFSGAQDIIRHSTSATGTLETGQTTAVPLVCYNPTRATTPFAVPGSSSKVRYTNFCDEGSRVDYITVQLTLRQTDTTKNNTCYIGRISTSFNEARLSDDLMDDNFGTGDHCLIEDEGDGEMNVHTSDLPITLGMQAYMTKDILQHNVRNMMSPQFQLYSGRVVTANQTIPLPFKNRRQQEGSLFAMTIMNDSTSATAGSDVEWRVDTFFKEIPSNPV